MLGADEKPDVKYSDVGGLDAQKQEIREAVELPLQQVSRSLPLAGHPCEMKTSETDRGRWICIGRSELIRRGVCFFTDRQVCPPCLFRQGVYPADLTYLVGTGKTMIVKAVANATSASFIRVVGSEFVQKYLGEVSVIRQCLSAQI
jgi:26S proteasome regulatory subunit T3